MELQASQYKLRILIMLPCGVFLFREGCIRDHYNILHWFSICKLEFTITNCDLQKIPLWIVHLFITYDNQTCCFSTALENLLIEFKLELMASSFVSSNPKTAPSQHKKQPPQIIKFNTFYNALHTYHSSYQHIIWISKVFTILGQLLSSEIKRRNCHYSYN